MLKSRGAEHISNTNFAEQLGNLYGKFFCKMLTSLFVQTGWAVCFLTLSNSLVTSTRAQEEVYCKPINEAQQELFYHQKDELASVFVFGNKINATESSEAELNTGTVKQWSQSEIAVVKNLLDCIAKRMPGFILYAAHDMHIKLFRVGLIRLKDKDHPNASAISRLNMIFVADAFFDSTNRLHTMVHELAHLVDLGQRFSLSKNWSQFAWSAISLIQEQERGLAKNDIDEFENEIKQTGRWPSLYGSENFSEAFAEYVTADLLPENFATSSIFKESFTTKVLLHGGADTKWGQNYCRGFEALVSKDYFNAIQFLQKANEIDNNVVNGHRFLAFAYLGVGKKSDSLREVNEARQLLKKNCVPEREKIYSDLESLSLWLTVGRGTNIVPFW
ncbi:hypothetical protein BH10CYA1_BH10CYA1_59000 [soil metagenome]